MPLYHVARPEDVARLQEEGFTVSGIQAWAAGVYLATDEETAALYESLDRERERLEVTAAVLHPFVVRVPDGDYDSIKVMHGAIFEAYGEEAAAGLNRETLRRERRALADAVTAVLQAQGHDSLRVEMGPVDIDDQRAVTVGGNQLVVFDPARVSVLGPTLERLPESPDIGW
jgi:hypothetical protein